MEQQVIDGNFLIAKFYGFTYPDMNNEIWKLSGDIHNYHEDWNKLMLVVEKIGKMNPLYPPTITTTSCSISSLSGMSLGSQSEGSMIENCWLCVVQFITWYNTENK